MVSAILLGAGESKRMGVNKLLLPWGKKTLLRHCLDALLRSKIKEVVIVLSVGSRGVVNQLKMRPVYARKQVKVTSNPHYQKGMSTSIRRGLKFMNPQSRGILIALGDQPLLKTRTINALIHAFDEGRGEIVVPLFQGKKGHPVIFHRKFEKDLLKLKGDMGARSILRKYPDHIKMVRVKSEGVIKDIDTWQEYEEGLRRKGRKRAR